MIFRYNEFRADTLVFFRLDIANSGSRASGYLSVDGSNESWQKIAEHDFQVPLVFQGLAASSNGSGKIVFKFGNIGRDFDLSAWSARAIGAGVSRYDVKLNQFPPTDKT